ncbi:MerR family transcriptional regulator [Ktedonobacteria bacterium brp13]|nr:MerR family transcriptional regulator [Ktedonobacteria bacterium brp13]
MIDATNIGTNAVMDNQSAKQLPSQELSSGAHEETVTSSSEQPGVFYTIEQVATRTGLTKRTLRYYEEVGLLKLTGRTEGNYRRYTEDEVQRIEHIKKLRDLLDFPLNDIRAILQADDEREQIREANRQDPDVQRKLERLERADELLQKQLTIVEHKIHGLTQMHEQLQQRLESHVAVKQALKDLLS